MSALRVGTYVRVERERPGSGTWWRYADREGWIASVNTQKFTDGHTHIEYGVTWNHRKDMARAHAEVWFLPNELVVIDSE